MKSKHFDRNIVGRDMVVGDLHAQYDLLMKLLHSKEIKFNIKVDRLYSVGDLIDRGPDSVKCLSLLWEPWFHAVKGNHEDILLIVLEENRPDSWDWWLQNGGLWAKSVPIDQLKLFYNKIQELPLAISVGEGEQRFNVIHAEFFGSDAELDAGYFDQRTEQVLLWSRTVWSKLPMSERGLKPKLNSNLSLTFCGHTILKNPEKQGSLFNIDTGAFMQTGYLTLVDVTNDIIYSTKNGNNRQFSNKIGIK